MHLISLLEPKLIFFEDNNLDKEQVIRFLIEKICNEFNLKDCVNKLYDLILEREKETSTVYPTGMAIPHLRIDGLNDTIIAICVPRTPVPHEAQEVRIFVLILTDKNVSSLYLNVVASFMRISRDNSLFDKLLNAKDALEFTTLIKKAEIVIKEEVTVSDVMTVNPLVINENETIKFLADQLSRHSLHYLPVVNDKGIWVGEVNLIQYLKISIPEYMQMLNNVNFLRSYEPFEKLYQQEDKLLVKDIMTRTERVLHPDFPIIEAVFEMSRQEKLTFPVIKDNKIVGVVTAMDIYRRVVRA